MSNHGDMSALTLKFKATNDELLEKLSNIGIPFNTLKDFLYEFLKLVYKFENLTPNFSISTFNVKELKAILLEKGHEFKTEKEFLSHVYIYLSKKNDENNNNNKNNDNKITGDGKKKKDTKKRNLESKEDFIEKKVKRDDNEIIKKSHSAETIEKTLLIEFNHKYVEILEQFKDSYNKNNGGSSGAGIDGDDSNTDKLDNRNSFYYVDTDLIKEFNRFFVIKYLERDMDTNELLAPPLIKQFWDQFSINHIQSYNRLLSLLGCSTTASIDKNISDSNGEVGESPNASISTPKLVTCLDDPKRYVTTLTLYGKHFKEPINQNIWVRDNSK